MRKIILTSFLLFLLALAGKNSFATCLGCGCNAGYNSCVDKGNFDCPVKYIDLATGQWVTADANNHKSCCRVGWRNCHEGFGVGFKWWGTITPNPENQLYTPFPEEALGATLMVAFSANGHVYGSNEGGQVIKPYNLLTQDELNQIAHLQPIINKILNGQLLTFDEMVAIN